MVIVDLTTGWLAWVFWPGLVLGTVLALVAIARFLHVSLRGTALVVAMVSFPVYLFWPVFTWPRDPSTPEGIRMMATSTAGSHIIILVMVVSWVTAIVAAFRARRGSPALRPPNMP